MEQTISPGICTLLYDHDCVIVPGFGGFVANYQPAKIHPTQHTFSPPSKKVAFNRSLQNNDGLLANHLVRTYSISYPDAGKVISDEVNRWNQTLSSKQKLQIPNIGTLSLDVEQNIRFEPSQKINFLIESFGMSEVQFLPVKKNVAGREQLKPKTKEWKAPTVAAGSSFMKLSGWKVAAAILMIIGVAELAWLSVKTNTFSDHNINFSNLNPFTDHSALTKKDLPLEPVKKESEIAAPDIIKEEGSIGTENTSTVSESQPAETETMEAPEMTRDDIGIEKKNSQVEIPEPPINNVSESTPIRKYHVVAGCFQIPENAEKLLSQLKSKGFHASISGKTNKGLTMVVYDVFDHRNEAVGLLKQVRATEDSTAWIFRN